MKPAKRKPERWMINIASHITSCLPDDPDAAREFLAVVGKIVDSFEDDDSIPATGYVLHNLPSDRKHAKAVLAMVATAVRAKAA
jgi:hypothetical protein